MSEREFTLGGLNKNVPLSEKIAYIHGELNRTVVDVDRISVAVYEPKTDVLKTFIHSSGNVDPLSNYHMRLAAVESLAEIVRTGKPRVVHDIGSYYVGAKEHSRKIVDQGYLSSYTLPMYLNEVFFGFIFFNSYQKNAFSAALDTLDVYGQMISLMVINELTLIHTMLVAVKTARDVTAYRDVETGVHLDRMSHYARIIAKALASKYGFNDEYIEHLFQFAPLHDIGKIGMPDSILRKRGPLTPQEQEQMKQHTVIGLEMIDGLLAEFQLKSLPYVDTLRNIIEFHHEKLDASGYLRGLRGEEIPIEARIVAVADIFDALTSQRPYKVAWYNDQAFAFLRSFAGRKLDADCVEALINNRAQVEQIQTHFRNSPPLPPAAAD